MNHWLASTRVISLVFDILETLPPLIIASIIFGLWWRVHSNRTLKQDPEKESS